MKTLIIFLISLSTFAQLSKDEQVTLSVNTEPNALLDGFNFGADLELQNKWFYVGVGTYQFPDLNNVGYQQYTGQAGFNWRPDNNRFYVGGLAGVVIRKGNPNNITGFEFGYQYMFGKFGVGIESYYSIREDAEFFYGDKYMWNTSVKIIYRIK